MYTRQALCFLLLGTLAAATYHADPEVGGAGADGSAAAPWPGLEQASAAGLLARLQPGDVLLLRSGDHGRPVIVGDKKATVTIAAAPGAVPCISGLQVNGCNWTFKGLTIGTVNGPASSGWLVSMGERADSAGLVIEDCFIRAVGDASAWTAEAWKAAPGGIQLGRRGKGLVARNNMIMNVRSGIEISAPGSLAEGNVVDGFSADGIRLTRSSITARMNVIRNCRVDAAAGDANHDDGIQAFPFHGDTAPLQDLQILDNIIIGSEAGRSGLASQCQGIGLFDGPFVRCMVERNVVSSATWHGVSIYDAQQCRIIDNMCYVGGGTKPHPRIMFGSKHEQVGEGNAATGNRAMDFIFKADPRAITKDNSVPSSADYDARLLAARALIDQTFGRIHQTSGLERLAATP